MHAGVRLVAPDREQGLERDIPKRQTLGRAANMLRWGGHPVLIHGGEVYIAREKKEGGGNIPQIVRVPLNRAGRRRARR